MNPDQLEKILRRELKNFDALLTCEKLTAGASQETYRLLVKLAGKETLLALRRSPLAPGSVESVGEVSLETEALLIQAMYEAGIPEPQIFYVLQIEDELGSGFVMEWLEGETLGARIVRSDELAEIRPQLAFKFGATLAQIHQVDAGAANLSDALQEFTPEQLVNESWNYYRELQIPLPMIDFTARWLLQHLPENYETRLVHGDYRNGNVMVNREGIVAVLDWEIAHLGDPVRDLGWLCVNSWRFGNHDQPVGGFGSREQLLEGYKSVNDIEVEPLHLRFWEVFGSFWWAVACLRMSYSYRSGDNPSPERPAIGRRSSEAQMDCVNLVIPGAYEIPQFDQAAAQLQELPLAQELLGSVGDWLKQEVAGQLDPRNAFLARVATNSLATVERELSLGPILHEQESVRLRSLGFDGDLHTMRMELTAQLREGLALDTEGLAQHLRQTVAGQLAIDQPKYSALCAS
jgi:aminoglycoside phosphotransferase (APT) family kinase protein